MAFDLALANKTCENQWPGTVVVDYTESPTFVPSGPYSPWVCGSQDAWCSMQHTFRCSKPEITPIPPPKCQCSGDKCGEECKIDVAGDGGKSKSEGSCAGSCSGEASQSGGDPVSVISGQQFISRKDLVLDAGTWNLDFEPYFTSKYEAHTVHGFGWNSILTMRMFHSGTKDFVVRDAHGGSDEFLSLNTTVTYPDTLRLKGGARLNTEFVAVSATGPYLYRTGKVYHYFNKDGALDSVTDGNGLIV